jgi:hypothetical protein
MNRALLASKESNHRRMSSYEDIRIFWEAWKQHTKRPLDDVDAANWDAAAAIFVAVAAGSSGTGMEEALAFVRDSLPEWHARLKAHTQWNTGAHRLRLYRGLRNESAILARVFGKAEIPPNRPISFALDRGSALRFAGQGIADGFLGVADVPLEDIVFADLDGFYREGNAHLEAEIIVVTREPLFMMCEVERVVPGARRIRNNSQKAKIHDERLRLEKFETNLMNENRQSKQLI